jgi:uncharacterized protein with HEPN domain
MEEDKISIEHIMDAILTIEQIVGDMTFDDYIANTGSCWGLVKMIEIIGEAANKVFQETQLRYSEIPWREIIGTRHILVHDYNTVDFKISFGKLYKQKYLH